MPKKLTGRLTFPRGSAADTPRPPRRTGQSYPKSRPTTLFSLSREVPFAKKDGTRVTQIKTVNCWGPGGMVAGFIDPTGELQPVSRRIKPGVMRIEERDPPKKKKPVVPPAPVVSKPKRGRSPK
jgi:hypothetical protein